jgi:hypothetical protein
MKEPITLETFNGHLVLYCKGHYNAKDKRIDFFDGLKRIWAVRCGYDYNPNEGDRVLEYIADSMFEIIAECKQFDTVERVKHFMDVIHKGVSDQSFKPEGMSPIRALIWEYRVVLIHLKVNDVPEGKKRYVPIVVLPKPMKQTFFRILNGNGNYDDYRKISQNNLEKSK